MAPSNANTGAGDPGARQNRFSGENTAAPHSEKCRPIQAAPRGGGAACSGSLINLEIVNQLTGGRLWCVRHGMSAVLGVGRKG